MIALLRIWVAELVFSISSESTFGSFTLIAFLEQCLDPMECVRHVCIESKWKIIKLQVADERPELRFQYK